MIIHPKDVNVLLGKIYWNDDVMYGAVNISIGGFYMDIEADNTVGIGTIRYVEYVDSQALVMTFQGYVNGDRNTSCLIEIPLFSFEKVKSSFYNNSIEPDHKNIITINNKNVLVCMGASPFRKIRVFGWDDLIVFNKYIFGKTWMHWAKYCGYETSIYTTDEYT